MRTLGATVAVLLGFAATAHAAPPLVDGKTAAVHDYTQAIRERVFIPQPGIDTDANGQMDWVTADVIRPDTADKVPAIIDSSPFYTTICRGRETECLADWEDDGVNDRWPLFYDNYFVPRGYAVVLAQHTGTGYTEHGCVLWNGPTDVAGQKSVIDWLNGRVPGYSAANVASAPKVAAWHNGSSGMVGQGADGGMAIAVATTGVEGLKTIVPINGNSNWYAQFHQGGILQGNRNRVAAGLDQQTQGNPNIPARPGVNLPSRSAVCMFQRQFILNDANADLGDGDAHEDVNTFWRERDFVRDAGKVKASVFNIFNRQSDEIRLDQLSVWWAALQADTTVPLKLWLPAGGYNDIFDLRRAVWVDTLHRWFDRYLYDVPNGIDSGPPVSIEDADGVWRDYASWPVPGSRDADVYLRAAADADAAGTLGAIPGGWRDSVGYRTANRPGDAYADDPTGAQTDRRVFLSQPLTRDVRLSGTPIVDLRAALGAPKTNLGAVIVDYGPSTQISRTAEGLTSLTTRTCWGATGAGDTCTTIGASCTPAPEVIDDACYLDTARVLTDVSQWRITRGVLDSSNRDSLWWQDATPVTPGQQYRFRFPAIPVDYTVKAGHRLGIILTGHHMTPTSALPGPLDVPVTVDTRASKVALPVVGGPEALVAAGAFADPTATVGGTVPATLALALGAPASFGAFAPGVAREYSAATTATVTSTAGDAALTVGDPSATAPGRLVNGPFALTQPLQGLGTVKRWDAPAANDVVAVTFKQAIGATDPLRTGTYAKALTFTLSTTAP
jgi:X-Pro dipeptidyl-peptidase